MGDEESQGFGRDLRGLVGRWPDADGILQGGLSEGLKDWDLWYVLASWGFMLLDTNVVLGVLLSSVCCSVCSCRCARVSSRRTWCLLECFRWFGSVRRW